MMSNLQNVTMPTKLFMSWGISEKLVFGLHMGIYGTQLLYFVEKYIFNDWDFLVSLTILIFLDTVFGSVRALKENTFQPFKKGIVGVATKIVVLACTVAAIGVIDNSRIGGQSSWFEGYIDAGAFAIMLAFEGVSVLKNLYFIKPTPIIGWLLKKLDLLTYIEKDNKNE